MKEKRRVRLFGCGKIAVEFYSNYKNHVIIEGAISNNPKEKVFSPQTGCDIEVERPKAKEKEESLIILCSMAYQEMAEQLILLGYEPFKDFIDYEMAELLIYEKEICLFYGFCHMRGIKEYMAEIREVKEKYTLCFVPNYLKLSFYQQWMLNFLIKNCHVFIYGMAVSQEYHRKNEAILNRLDKAVKKVCVPAVYFSGYFPQEDRPINRFVKYGIKSEGHDYSPFTYDDGWLNDCIEKEMDDDAAIEYLLHTEIWPKEKVQKNLEKEIGRLKYQDKLCDFSIAEYIEEHYDKVRLFRNEAHMENCLLKLYVSQLLEQLNIQAIVSDVKESLLKCSEHPIYPFAASALDLKWDVLAEPLEFYTYQGWHTVTLEEYIRTYLFYSRQVKKMRGMALLP